MRSIMCLVSTSAAGWLLCALFVFNSAQAASRPVHIVATVSSYGSIAKSIGKDRVTVTSIIQRPNSDPHDYEPTAAVARQVTTADVIVMNGLGYDGWMSKLLQASPSAQRQVVNAGKVASYLVLANHNPHLFYSPRAMLAVAARIAHVLSEMDPAHAKDYAANLAQFQQQLLSVYAQVQQLMVAHPRLNTAATEPIAGYLLHFLGYKRLYMTVQLAAMNDSKPDIQAMKAFIQGLKNHTVQLFIYNKQVQDHLTRKLLAVAKQSHIPTVGMTEIPLPEETYIQWQLKQLQNMRQALRQP